MKPAILSFLEDVSDVLVVVIAKYPAFTSGSEAANVPPSFSGMLEKLRLDVAGPFLVNKDARLSPRPRSVAVGCVSDIDHHLIEISVGIGAYARDSGFERLS